MNTSLMKKTRIMEDIALQFHPEFKTNKDLARVWTPYFNTEYLVEEALAHVGGYDFIDGEHCDFTDGSDSKTASISPNATKKDGVATNSYRGEVSGVVAQSGVLKAGALRVILFNPHHDRLDYFFMPRDEWSEIGINIHPTTKKGRIFFTWNATKDICPKIDKFKVADFETLAKAK